jgi:hypothetical protein
MDDRGRREPVRREAIEDFLEVGDRTEMETQEVAVLARDPVALGHFGCVFRDLGYALELPRRGPDADNCRDRIAEGRRVEIRVVAADRTVALEPLDPLGDGRRRQPDPATELRHAQATLALELSEDAQVDVVEEIRCVG